MTSSYELPLGEQPNLAASNLALPCEATPSHWQAYLTLGFNHTPRGTVLKTCDHKGPLYVQKAFYPEGASTAHTYLLHPPGGLVSGDKLNITANLNQDCHVLITTPGAGRVYRAREDRLLQQQVTQLNLAKNSILEWLPQETILYPNANTRLESHISLSTGSRYIGWEITCFGLPANDLGFANGQAEQGIEIRLDDKLVLRERLTIQDVNRALMFKAAGLRNAPINGFMVAGPFCSSLDLDPLLRQLREACEAHPATTGVTLISNFIVIRSLHHDSESMKQLFTQCWSYIRPALINMNICEPRIWAT